MSRKSSKTEIHRHTLVVVGNAAGEWRREHGITQLQIADELNMSYANVSAFERGQNDSALILMWYILHGFDPLERENVWLLLTT